MTTNRSDRIKQMLSGTHSASQVLALLKMWIPTAADQEEIRQVLPELKADMEEARLELEGLARCYEYLQKLSSCPPSPTEQ